jgi:hypothetical protein
MFRELLAHPQEVLHKRHLVILRAEISRYLNTFKYLLISAPNIQNVVCETPPEDEQVMLETCRGP